MEVRERVREAAGRAQARLQHSTLLARLFRRNDSSSAAMLEMVQHSASPNSSGIRLSSAAIADDDAEERDPHVPGSIPPWVHISSAEDDTLIPPPVRPNTRHYKPPPSHYKPGRKWDTIRTAEPPLMSAPIADHQTRWVPFMQSGPQAPWHEQGARLMTPEWMEDNVPITARNWEEEDEALADKQEELKGFWLLSPEKRERTVRLFWVSLFYFLAFIFDKHIVCLSEHGLSSVDDSNRHQNSHTCHDRRRRSGALREEAK
jgi:hypothetical protein